MSSPFCAEFSGTSNETFKPSVPAQIFGAEKKEVIYSSLDKIRKMVPLPTSITYSQHSPSGPHVTTIGVSDSDQPATSCSPPDPLPSIVTVPVRTSRLPYRSYSLPVGARIIHNSFHSPPFPDPPTVLRENNPVLPSELPPSVHLSVNTSTGQNYSNQLLVRNGSLRSPIRRDKAPQTWKLQSVMEEDIVDIDSEQVKRMSKAPNGKEELAKKNQTLLHEVDRWAGAKLAGQVAHSNTNSIRNYWQHNVAKEQQLRDLEQQQNSRRKAFGFPKWRSTDALSASLVASNPVAIPSDSRIPEQRLKKMHDTDLEAEYVKKVIHDSIEPTRPLHTLHKGKSLESLVIQSEKQPWYDKEKIKEAVSRESIANIHQSIMKFEHGLVTNNGRDRSPAQSGSYSVELIPPPLPPKSQQVQIRQHANRSQTQPIKFNEIPLNVTNGYQPSYQSNRMNGFHDEHTNGLNGRANEAMQPSPRDPFEAEEELFLLYMRQNPDIVSSVGLIIPESTRQMMEELGWKRVELRESENTNGHGQTTNGYEHNSHDFGAAYNQQPRQNGRYIKKSQNSVSDTVNGVSRVAVKLRRAVEARESLIEEEIRQLREREDELRRSRSELGLPSLEDTMDIWRSGRKLMVTLIPSNGGMTKALSYDHLHHHSEMENGINGHGDMISVADLATHQHIESPIVQNLHNNDYRLHKTNDNDVMFYGPTRIRGTR